MKLGLTTGYSGATASVNIPLVQEAERLGYDIVWTAEAYGSDAVVPLAWLGAHTARIRLGTGIMQMAGRTPANTAMTAMTLDHLSGGRMVLGIGASGPQVVEGWHGVAYGKLIGKTREYVSILRKIFAREGPLTHEGNHYTIPYQGEDATGLGKPLKSIVHGRADLPIYIAAIGPMNVALAAEVADGLIPVFFSPERFSLIDESLQEGFRKAGGGKNLDTFDLAPVVAVVLGDDVQACRDQVKLNLALYIGGMGARGRNFYYTLARRYGYEEAAEKIQDAYLAGQKGEAIAAVPDALVDEVSLCGPKERIADRLSLWREARIHTLTVGAPDVDTVRTMAELVL
ncbi:MAG: LLM class F420-dependent oxidoreductase [SAR324 cluster bacterium]|nr:LLM class F420-dependent oxidoreductase [SAR324 cluster bacterium]